MSEPIWRRLLDLGTELGASWHPVHGAGPQLDATPEPAVLGEAEIVEDGGDLRIRDVGPPVESNFEFSLDGIEHTRIVGYVGTVPLVHGYVAAVIRKRTDRSFTTWRAAEEEVVAFPHSLLDRDHLLALGLPNSTLINSDVEDDARHPIRLAESGRAAIKRHRAGLERRLAKHWAKAGPHSGWMLVDGSLAIDPGLASSGRAIGLVKSHRTQFLDTAAMPTVLEMGAGQRSSVFRPLRPQVGEVHSWYLRLRAPVGHDIYWALARIEGRVDQETLDMADEVSRWLLAETTPLSLPDPRWHVLLYPIRDCEQYLRARMPTLDIT